MGVIERRRGGIFVDDLLELSNKMTNIMILFFFMDCFIIDMIILFFYGQMKNSMTNFIDKLVA
jgi:hypothetical protein